MRSGKKIAAWMLAAAMATGLLAGCGGSSGNETTAAASAAEEVGGQAVLGRQT